MSGFCDDCGNTICLCDEVAEQVERYGTADAVEYWRDRAYAAESEAARLKREVSALEHARWEPQDGVWLVHRHNHGTGYTWVAGLDDDRSEAIIRALLQVHGDTATRAIMGTYERERFCPTMLEHEDHDGSCGVWPSAWTIWTNIRDALASELALIEGGRG